VLIPLAILPDNVGRAVLVMVAIAAMVYALRKLGAKPPGVAAFLLSPPIMHSIQTANLHTPSTRAAFS
jgi:hypothetical protein